MLSIKETQNNDLRDFSAPLGPTIKAKSH